MAQSEGYTAKQSALNTIAVIQRNAAPGFLFSSLMLR